MNDQVSVVILENSMNLNELSSAADSMETRLRLISQDSEHDGKHVVDGRSTRIRGDQIRRKTYLVALLIAAASSTGCSRESADAKLAEGKRLYDHSCASCHLRNGEGKPGVGPSLVGTSWVTGSPEQLARISLYGVRGPIVVNGQEFNLEMPGLFYYQFDDEQMAAVLSYIRHAWGNDASPVSAELVAKIRKDHGQRDSWTVEELAEIE